MNILILPSSVHCSCLSPFHGLCFSVFFFFLITWAVLSSLSFFPPLHICDCLCLSGIDTEDGSAKKDEDFKGKSQRQVQFNPGQTRATWRVRILTDGRYEQAETFQILLSEPVMGVLEFPTAATVEILDPSDGQ